MSRSRMRSRRSASTPTAVLISRVLQRIAMLKQDVHPINNTAMATGTAVLQSSQRNTSPQQQVFFDAAPFDGATEWRTPPLWGVRDSSPYLHDGRAKTLETTVAFHSGEGDESRLRFFVMPDEDQQLVIAFLKTLTAPDTGD